MKITTLKNPIKMIGQGDKDFTLKAGVFSAPRAGFEIVSECPKEYKKIINECINLGWLRPVAFIRDDDLMWERLKG